MPDKVKHGDVLPVVGGPLDGETRRVERLFPWCPDLLDAGFTTINGKHWYKRVGRQYVYEQPSESKESK